MTGWRITAWPVWSRRLTTALFFFVVNWLMLAPATAFREVREFLPHQDKIVHGALFLTLACFVRWSLKAPSAWQGLFVALMGYAGAIEALQPVLGGAGRRFDWLDMASNLAGVLGGWWLFGKVAAARVRGAGGRQDDQGTPV